MRLKIVTLIVGLCIYNNASTTPEDLKEEKPKTKILLLGIDGISKNLLQPYAQDGVIPHLDAIAQKGQGALASFWPLRTMQVWTSIVTGKLPGQHGIWDHITNSFYNPPGFRTKKRRVYLSTARRSKALWQLLGERGFKTLTVGWPTTWPAEQVPNGILVAPKVLYGDLRDVTIKGSFWRHVNNAVQPEALLPQVRQMIVETQEISAEELAQWADIPPEGDPIYSLPKIKSYVYALRWNLARARSMEAITIGLARERHSDVVLAYFQCTDSLLHRFWIFQKSEAEIAQRLKQFNIPTNKVPELKRRFGQVVRHCYHDVDQRVGRILEALQGPNTWVLVVSDHGFGDGPKKHPFKAEPYGGIHWSNGAILAQGPYMPASSQMKNASVLDITPTILYILGLEVGDDMRGKVIQSMFKDSYLKQHPVKRIPTYEKKPQLWAPYSQGFPPKPRSFVW